MKLVEENTLIKVTIHQRKCSVFEGLQFWDKLYCATSRNYSIMIEAENGNITFKSKCVGHG
jgi:hypothetical protein